MSSWFRLTLDTHAPVVTFGAPDSSGGALSVPYTIDEPAIASAWVVDAAGLRVDLAVQPARLYAVLPDTIASGWATVTAHAVDDVGNAQDYTLAVMLVGGAPPPPEPGPRYPGRPNAVAPRPRKFVRSRAVTRQACPTEVRRGVVVSRTVARTGTRADARAMVETRTALEATSTASTRVHITASEATRAQTAVVNVAPRRRVGRSVEEALLLDLL